MFKGLKTEGIFSHFSVADALDAESEAYTARQRACFDAVVRRLQSAGLELPYIHLQNSAGIIRHPEPAVQHGTNGHFDVRAAAEP